MRLLLKITLFSLFLNNSIAQDSLYTKPLMQFPCSFLYQIPIGDFDDNLDKSLLGGSFELLFPLSNNKFWTGVGMNSSVTDRESLRFRQMIAGYDRKYELKTHNSYLFIKGIFKYQPGTGLSKKLIPYFEGSLGAHRLWTKTDLIDKGKGDHVLESEKENSDWGVSGGVSAGLHIGFRKNFRTALDMRLSYIVGSSSEYFVRKSNVRVMENPIEAFELKESSLSMISLNIGFVFYTRRSRRINRFRPKPPETIHL